MPSAPEDRPTPAPGDRPAPPPGSAEDALRRLEQRLDRASEAAERLMSQATAAAGGGGNPSVEEPGTPPSAGWQVPGDDRAGTPDLDPLVALVQALRDLVPPDLQRRLLAALRELLLALRALIDWYLEHLERRREQAVEVQDIPIL
jgi:hypothetical protein